MGFCSHQGKRQMSGIPDPNTNSIKATIECLCYDGGICYYLIGLVN
jgi:hypothetical protein